ncbi:MAG TPA: glycosyltransferase [Anaerolineales bacterium]|nr:glycosyltransferase [Anaerolineales bacterium]
MNASICLNMIVKNEAHVIKRCLDSITGLFDHWVIIDTGSTDGTEDLIKDLLKDVPGEIIDRPWVNFGYNRTEAIKLAKDKADYLMFIDADDVISTDEEFTLPKLNKDRYMIDIHHGGIIYQRPFLVSTRIHCEYVGPVHEYLRCSEPHTSDHLENILIRFIGGGARSLVEPKEKYLGDAEILKKALLYDPNNPRNVFYLAQSYRDAGCLELALIKYEQRSKMFDFEEEVFYSLLQVARISAIQKYPEEDVIYRFLSAHEYRPTRAEALGSLAQWCRLNGKRWALSYLFASRALGIPKPNDILFVENDWYDWRILDELSISAYKIGRIEEAKFCIKKILSKSTRIPQEDMKRIIKNGVIIINGV